MSAIIDAFEKVCKNNENIAMYYVYKNELKSKTFSKLHEDVEIICSYLIDKGVQKGEKILAFANSGYNLCVCIMAIFKLGASVMYVDINAKQDSLKHIFEKYKPQYILVSNKTKRIKFVFKEFNKIKKIINIDKINEYKVNEKKVFQQVDEDTPALITVTTGTMGIPKTFIRSHKDLYNQLMLVTNNIEKRVDNEIVLTTSYMYIFANILQGFSTVLPNVNLGSNNINKIMKRLKMFKDLDISMIITSPDFCLKTPNIYPKLHTLYCGGAILNYNECKRILDKYPNIIYIYGSTECNLISRVSLKEYEDNLEKNGTCMLGDVCNGVSVKIDDLQHILVHSEALLTKSLDTIEINDNYYNTQDIGFVDNNKLFYIGKEGSKIYINGELMYSNEIEQQVILKFKNIEKCAMLQHNNKYYLFIEDYNVNKSDIKKFVENKYKISINVIMMKIIPRDIKHHTKINYRKLQLILDKRGD